MNNREIYLQLGLEARVWAATRTDFSDLNGMCARASAKLFRLLERSGLKPQLVTYSNALGSHVVCEVVDEHEVDMIDVTATQFGDGHKEVEILPTEEAAQKTGYYYWNENRKVYGSPEELREAQLKSSWPAQQLVNLQEIDEE